MTVAVRIALVVVGLAATVHGLALTGCWLGFPPRYEVITPSAVEAAGKRVWVACEPALRDGGEAIAIGLIVLGMVMTAVGAWPPLATRGGRGVTGALRIVLVGVGVAAVVYGVSGLSGYFVPVVRLVPIPLGLLLTLVGAWPRWPGGPSP